MWYAIKWTLLLEFKDVIWEGDGNRIIRCWRYMLLIYKATGHTNYATEALNTLLQLRYFFSPRMAAQLKWNRTVNVHGREAKNIPADLYMEHLNRECKMSDDLSRNGFKYYRGVYFACITCTEATDHNIV